jgi:hypothetical protein
MNISGGISEIGFPGVYGPQKVYLWPVYNAGVVDPLFKVARDTDGQQIIKNNVPEKDREKVMDETQKLAGQIYSRRGQSMSNLCSPAGSLFDAYV